VRTTVIGSGDAFGSGGRFQTCIALADDAASPPHTLIDCGATSMVALRQHTVDVNAIDTVLVTHLHGDHFGGLPFLVLDGQFRRRTTDLTVVGPPGTEQRLTDAMEVLFPGSSTARRRFAVHVREHRHGTAHHGQRISATPFEVRHASGAPAYALRVRHHVSQAVVAYSGDTEWTDALLETAEGAQVFFCEGYTTRRVPWHLDLDTLSAHAHRINCEQLVLTHMSPEVLALDNLDWPRAHDGIALDVWP
jgi:ribonuclease BN (tRNA processing enzyme)